LVKIGPAALFALAVAPWYDGGRQGEIRFGPDIATLPVEPILMSQG
jgi:hypothetical protein